MSANDTINRRLPTMTSDRGSYRGLIVGFLLASVCVIAVGIALAVVLDGFDAPLVFVVASGVAVLSYMGIRDRER